MGFDTRFQFPKSSRFLVRETSYVDEKLVVMRLSDDPQFVADVLGGMRLIDLYVKYSPACKTTVKRWKRHVLENGCGTTPGPRIRNKNGSFASESPDIPNRATGHIPSGFDPTQCPLEEDRTQESVTFTGVRSQSVTVEDIIAERNIDTTIWECERFRAQNKYWQVTTKDSEDNPVVTQMEGKTISCTFKLRKVMVSVKAEIEALIEDAKLGAYLFPNIAYTHSAEGHLLELVIPDLHVSKLAWADETGTDYDSDIACRVYMESIDALIKRVSVHSIDRVLLAVGNDLLHVDNMMLQTTGGTQMHADDRYKRTFRKVRIMISDAVIRLREVAPVDVVMVAGNHDEQSVFCLGDSLQCYFDRTPHVSINNDGNDVNYYQYHSNMIMLTHGNNGKKINYGQLAATDQPRMWADTTYREAHVGHLHQMNVSEQMGFVIRVLPSLSGTDSWHKKNHFVHNRRQADGIVWSKEDGPIAVHSYPVKG